MLESNVSAAVGGGGVSGGFNGGFVSNSIVIGCDIVPNALTPAGMVGCIWKFDGGIWCPEGLPANDAVLTLNDTATGNYVDVLALLQDNGEGSYGPALLATNGAWVVQRDMSVGGMINSEQGV
jgi:hypothetical protein